MTLPSTNQPAVTDERRAFIAGLRDLAEFLERHPQVPFPIYSSFNVFVRDRDELVAIARAASWEKDYSEDWFVLRRSFGEHLKFDVNTERERVCRRVVVGQKTIPAQPARVVDDVEWVCDDAILAGGRS